MLCHLRKKPDDQMEEDGQARKKRTAKSEKKSEKSEKSAKTTGSPKTTGTGIARPGDGDGVCVITRPVPLAPELYRLCYNLFMQWNCIKEHLSFVDSEVREALEGVLFTLLQTARQKCKGKNL